MNTMLTDTLRAWLSDECWSIAKEGGMKEGPIKGWDGEVWTCIVRAKRNQGFAEAAVRLRPDPMNEGAEMTVSARAWKAENPKGGWSRTYWALFVTPDLPESQTASAVRERLRERLREAWETAKIKVTQLDQLQEDRKTHLEILRQKLDGLRGLRRS